MRRIMHTGLGYEVLHVKVPGEPGEPPVDARVLRFIDGDTATLLDFPLADEDWEEIVRQGDRDAAKTEDPLAKAGFQVMSSMPEVLRKRPDGPRR